MGLKVQSHISPLVYETMDIDGSFKASIYIYEGIGFVIDNLMYVDGGNLWEPDHKGVFVFVMLENLHRMHL